MNYFLVPCIVATLFCAIKLIEEYYVNKNIEVGLKFIVRDACLVLLCAVVATIGVHTFDSQFVNFMNMVTQTKTPVVEGATQIFTGNPEF